MNPFWNPLVSSLDPYVAGEQPRIVNLIKLNTNESPYGPSPKAVEAIRNAADDHLRLYPDPEATSLKDAIADFYGLSRAEVFVGNGSDEVLAHVFLGLLKHERPLLLPDITYSFYPTYAGLYGMKYETIAVDEDFRIRVDDYLNRDAGAIIVVNPNAPTGLLLELSEIERLVQAHPTIPVVVDEAYIDFGGQSATGLIRRYPNLLVVQTMSKSRSLAGLRIGFAVGDPGLIEGLERVKNCFNSYPMDRLAIAGATAAMQDRDYFEQCRDKVIFSRGRLAAELGALGFRVLPSMTNFLFARHPVRDAGELARLLREQGVLVRHFRKPERIAQFLRITIGTDEQCDALVDALRGILG